jgi:5-methylcytosine-specific restriction endonuclease McrA
MKYKTKHTVKTKNKISESESETKKKLFAEGKLKIWNKGIPMSEAQKDKLSKILTNGIGKAEVTCLGCGIKFKVSPSRIKSGRGRYHSKECQYKAKLGSGIKKYCQYCGNLIPGDGDKYCNRICMGLAMSGENSPAKRPEVRKNMSKAHTGLKSPLKGIPRPDFQGENNPCYKSGLPKCEKCGKELSDYDSELCKEHYLESLSGKGNPAWLNGISKLPYSFDFDERLKDFIRDREKHKCLLCEVPEKELDKKLCVHHIDYNKKNSSEVNLVALCNSCNIKVNTNRKYWENYFTDLMISKIDFSKKET